MSDEAQLPTKILVLAVNENILAVVKETCQSCNIEQISALKEFEDRFDEFDDSHFAAIICSSELGLEFPLEAAQILRNQCPRTPSFYVSFDQGNFKPALYEKNGFSNNFLLPIDKKNLVGELIECLNPEAIAKKNYRTVKLIDIKPNTVLGFNTYVFLPLNHKYVKLTSKDQGLTDKKLEKLKEQNENTLYIEQKDMGLFYEYTAEQLQDLAQGTGPMSETEREEKLKESIRGLFISLFDQTEDYDTGKDMLNTCQNIVSTYILGSSKENWYNQILAVIGGSTGGYDNSARVSTYAAMFAIGLGHESPEDLAMAGFLHDISLSDFPEEVLSLPESEWSKEQKEVYCNHPQKSVNIVKTKKMILNPNVEKAILQHHEQFSGKGFPLGLSGNKIHEDAQILSFADQFHWLTSKVEGKQTFTPIEACHEIEKTSSISPVITQSIKKLLSKS